jgi:hypothetical protein
MRRRTVRYLPHFVRLLYGGCPLTGRITDRHTALLSEAPPWPHLHAVLPGEFVCVRALPVTVDIYQVPNGYLSPAAATATGPRSLLGHLKCTGECGRIILGQLADLATGECCEITDLGSVLRPNTGGSICAAIV